MEPFLSLLVLNSVQILLPHEEFSFGIFLYCVYFNCSQGFLYLSQVIFNFQIIWTNMKKIRVDILLTIALQMSLSSSLPTLFFLLTILHGFLDIISGLLNSLCERHHKLLYKLNIVLFAQINCSAFLCHVTAQLLIISACSIKNQL